MLSRGNHGVGSGSGKKTSKADQGLPEGHSELKRETHPSFSGWIVHPKVSAC